MEPIAYAVIEYALARDNLYRALKADDKTFDAASARMREIADKLWDLGHQLTEQKKEA